MVAQLAEPMAVAPAVGRRPRVARLFSFKGRSSETQFWATFLVALITLFVLNTITSAVWPAIDRMRGSSPPAFGGAVALIAAAYATVFWIQIANVARRCRDAGRAVLPFTLASCPPVIGMFVAIYVGTRPPKSDGEAASADAAREAPSAVDAPSSSAAATDRWRSHLRTSDRVFQASLAVTATVSAFLLYFVVMGADGGPIFGASQLTWVNALQITVGFGFMYVLWGGVWYAAKFLALTRIAGFSEQEARESFRSRMNAPFDLSELLSRHSERRIRIADMIGRRGRFVTIGLLGFWSIYAAVAREANASFLVGTQNSLFDIVIAMWITLLLYRSDGWVARMVLGPQSRIMDGTLGRANCVLIQTLWSVFRFVMVPIGIRLAHVFPARTYAILFAFIWVSYLTADGLSEIIGSLFGKQKLRVWGLGEVNRKSIAGTWACFLGSLAVCSALVWANGLPPSWYGLAFTVSITNTFFELFSPRGTDDFTMATANALVCWGFGALVY